MRIKHPVVTRESSVKRVYCAANFTEAHLLRQMLGREGIAVKVFNENAQSGLGDIPFTQTYPEIWLVNDRDEARARTLLQAYERASAPERQVSCRACHETNPANFDLCWNCGASLA